MFFTPEEPPAPPLTRWSISDGPAASSYCVLIDRGHRELPIQANYVGRVVQTADNEVIEVRLKEVDQEERVMMCERVQ